MSSRVRLLLACLATGALVVPIGWLWWASLMPDEYSVMEMGYVDLGGGPDLAPAAGHGAQGGMHAGAVDIATLVAPKDGAADVSVDLTAREERFELASGREVSGYTLNGSSPGPTLRAAEGDLVEVRLTNDNIPDGITLHWHGIDVPNAMDGVAGVTQDAVAEGETFTYRFVADQVGTYWYHSHQVSHEQVRRGLLGAVVVEPSEPTAEDLDVEAVVHMYDGQRTVNGQDEQVVEAEPGQVARVRVVNTDNDHMTSWVSGADYRVVAVDGTDVNDPGEVSEEGVVVTAGGRVDLEVVVPETGVRVELGGNAALVLGPGTGEVAKEPAPKNVVDLLSYGSPTASGIDVGDPDREFEYVIGRRPGFHDGRPGIWWTVNGHMWPDVPMYTVTTDDVVTMRIENNSGEGHPMHLHGHHALVLSRNGEAASGSPWWVDSLDVAAGDTFEIAFVADNPGVWMDHCHNLPHAAEGLVAHLMYAGYDTPFAIGGAGKNDPE